MKLKIGVMLVVSAFATQTLAANEVVVMSCGASHGKAYFFDGKGWVDDGISQGKIVLIANAGGIEDEFDIRYDDSFSDMLGGRGYILDGAQVYSVSSANRRHSFIAIHSNYTDQYTFDLNRNEVLWTSHKIGTIVPKVAIYYAECS